MDRSRLALGTGWLAALLLIGCGGSSGAKNDGGSDGGGDDANNADAGDDAGTDTAAGPPTLRLGKNVTSLKVGQSERITVEALDGNGQKVTFLPQTFGDCVTTKYDADSITVTGLRAGCTQQINITAGEDLVRKKLTVNGYDPLAMDIGDGLLVSYVNAYTREWNDAGSSGAQNVAFWRPVADTADGWYALGSTVVPGYADLNATKDVAMVVAKDTSTAQDLLVSPTSYLLVWDDHGSGATSPGSIWTAVCPVGYAALGAVVQAGYESPPDSASRCVKESYTVRGTAGPAVYTNAGIAGEADLGVWLIGPPSLPSSPDGRAALPVGSVLACPSHDASACDLSSANLLLVPMPIMQSSDDGGVQPKLGGPMPLDPGPPHFFSSVRVPFSLIPSENPGCGTSACATAGSRVDANVHTSPFYYLQRQESYASVKELDNRQGANPAALDDVVSNTLLDADATAFSQQVGLAVTVSGDAKFVGAGGGYAVDLGAKLGWDQPRAATFAPAQMSAFTFDVPAGGYADLIQVQTQFRAVSEPGAATAAALTAGQNTVTNLQWP